MWRVAIVTLAVAAATVPTPAGLVERLYSNGAYAALQPPVTALSNRVPFALFDLLLAIVVGLWLVLAVGDVAGVGRGSGRGGFRAAGRVAWRTVVWTAGLYVAFLLAWGLNYRRTPLVERVPFDEGAVTSDAARALALTAAEQLNGLHAVAHQAGWPAPGVVDASLAASLAHADRDTGGRGVVTAGRPKPSLLDPYFLRTATAGMTNPYFLETLVSSGILPFERPFVAAHEWGHLAGRADEGDANFLAWLACVRASPPAQYSGWLFLYSEVAGVLGADARGEVAARLAAGPRADLTAIRERLARQVDPRLAEAGRRVYDRYLKANRVDDGIASYGHVVRLVLGVRFGPGWTVPAR